MYSNIPLVNPHTSSYIDVDGDCINDLIIMSEVSEIINQKNLKPITEVGNATNPNATTTENKVRQIVKKTKYLEIWRGIVQNDTILYCLSQSSVYELKNNLGLPSLVDIDRNGSLDIVFPVLESPPKILVGLNKIPVAYDWTQDYCSTHIKTYEKATPLLYDDFVLDKNTATMQTYPLSNSNQETYYSDNLVSPLIRFEDINSDSFPDFIVTLYNKEKNSSIVKIFYNYELKFNGKGTGMRAYSINNTYVNSAINNVTYSSFFDIAEDGKLDVIIVNKQSENLYETIGLFNTYVYDCYYLKSMILKQKRIHYANQIGVTFRYICADVDGTRRMDLATQTTQLNELSLNLPYAFIGVGRSNNYIENFHVINGNNANVILF